MSKLALAMIVKGTKDEAKLLDNCLASVKGYVDGIFITINAPDGKQPHKSVTSVARKYGAVINYAVWNGNFAEMRNLSFSYVTEDYDWIMWLDADDTVSNPMKIKELLEKAQPTLDGIMVRYNYDKDEYGNITTVHTNLRIVRNNGAFTWRGTLHETLIENRRVNRAVTDDFAVYHESDGKRRDESNARNIQIMERMLDEEETDPRTLYYLGTAYIDAGRTSEAREMLETYLKLSGWDEERSHAHVWLGRIYLAEENDTEAVKHLLYAMFENPKETTARVELAAYEMSNKRWSKAIVWLEEAMVMKKAESTALVMNPLETTYRTYLMLSQCHFSIGGKNLELALKLAQKAHAIRPDNIATEYVEMLKHVLRERDTVASFINALSRVDESKVEHIYAKLDDEYKKNPAVIAAMRKYRQPKVWPKKSIAIYCGSGVLKEWGPWSLESGIGGSEEAVIRISKHFVSMGWDVTVYAEPAARDGVYDGVKWVNHWEIDLRDTYDVFVVWRAPWFFDAKINARKKYLWLHDVMDDAEFTKERLANIDKVMLLSHYHKTVFPSIPEDKVFYTGNGIDPADFVEADGKYERNQYQVCYMSSHVRGLEYLLDIWPDVKKAVPEATLKIAYGWQSFDEVNRNNPERMAWKDAIVHKIQELDGVEDLGRIGQGEIVRLINESGVWAYPTTFSEIYCITCVKAQAGGAWPVCTDFAALAEYVNHGDVIHMEAVNDKLPLGKMTADLLEDYKQNLIARLKNPVTDEQRLTMMNDVRERYSWRNTAEGWAKDFES